MTILGPSKMAHSQTWAMKAMVMMSKTPTKTMVVQISCFQETTWESLQFIPKWIQAFLRRSLCVSQSTWWIMITHWQMSRFFCYPPMMLALSVISANSRLSSTGTLIMKSISTSCCVPEMTANVLAHFQVYQQQLCLGAASEWEFSLSKTTWLPSEDVHLLEIVLDRDYASATDAAFQRCSWAVFDATDGSPLIAIWTNVVGPLFNNFDNYQPEPHFFWWEWHCSSSVWS